MIGENRARYGAPSTGQCRILRACARPTGLVSWRQMRSLGQLLTVHSPILLLDAASTRVQVGWFPSADLATAKWAAAEEEAGVGIFRCIEELGIDVGRAAAFIFCDGPGSTLGVRTTAIALRTWQVLSPRPNYAYHSLAVVAAAVGRKDVTVIADARRESWHTLGHGGPLTRAMTAELSGNLLTPENFRHWSTLPEGTTQVPYDLKAMLPCVADADLFWPIESPDAFLHEEPNYITWTPRVHQSPS